MDIRQVIIFANPISGSGSALATAKQLQTEISSNGCSAELIASTLVDDITAAEKQVSDSDLVIVCGGDGSLMNMLPTLARTQTPVYMYPSGNESLFAKEFGVQKSQQQLLNAIRRPKLEQRPLASVNEKLFFTMSSIGLDSCVIKRISESRTSPIGHLGYALPTIQEMLSFSKPSISLSVDGQRVINDEPGFLVIGNTGQYALGAPFLPEAPTQDGKLAARFFPNAGLACYISWPLRTLLGLEVNLAGSRFFTGKHFELSTTEHYPVQADGEYIGETQATIKAEAGYIRVLMP